MGEPGAGALDGIGIRRDDGQNRGRPHAYADGNDCRDFDAVGDEYRRSGSTPVERG
jgi:hypothetical protein